MALIGSTAESLLIETAELKRHKLPFVLPDGGWMRVKLSEINC
jgi:hypothetical protein